MTEAAARRSKELFDSGLYCAESVLATIAEANGIHSDLIPKVATGFCAGMGRTSGQCGAVSGAILGLGLSAGRSTADESVEHCFALVQDFLSRFDELFGSTNCLQLIGLDLMTEDGLKAYNDRNLFVQCSQYTQEATSIAMRLMAE